MTNEKIKRFGALALALLWLGLSAAAWMKRPGDISETERRKLAQLPKLTGETILSGKFMTGFESYTLDQFPLRDSFRQMKAMFHYYVLGQTDNNGIYLAQGQAVKAEYPLKPEEVNFALDKFQKLYEAYLRDSGSKCYAAVVPDKGYYLQGRGNYLTMDYETLFSMVEAGLPWAESVDITDTLSLEDYYATDTHWRQERLIPAARRLAEALGIPEPEEADFTKTPAERPFYGVYYGQAALPMEPETLYTMENEVLSRCAVYNFENGKTTQVYDGDKLTSRDLYDVFLSGAAALLTVENPNAATDKELIVFRDSFGSSLVPLLIPGYARVTLVDIRYVQGEMLGSLIDFHGQDVLFLYSTLVLNNSGSLK